MINLLPSAIKDELLYARRNTRLRSWIITSAAALIGVGLLISGGYLYMQKSISDLNSQVAQASDGLKAQKLDQTSKQVDEISANTKLVVQVLSREVLFSKLLRQLGASLPAKTALTRLVVDKVEGGLQITAAAQDFNAASQIQVNLQDPKNQIFEKADIVGIDCASGTVAQYPCNVTLKALFGKNNQYFYIAPPTKSTTSEVKQ
jgi:Tfp pilus assembly protein PilN